MNVRGCNDAISRDINVSTAMESCRYTYAWISSTIATPNEPCYHQGCSRFRVMTLHRYTVVFACPDSHGVMPLEAEDREAAWETARETFPECRLALVNADEDDD